MKYILIVLLWALPTFGFAETMILESPVQMILPIDVTSSSEYNLIVSIPKGYVALQDLESLDTAILIEFVPKGENGKNWSEIITVHKLIGERVSANTFMQKFKAKLLEKTTNGKVLKDSYETLPNYQKATLLISYENGQQEILGAKYFSGPFDCVGVQYTIRGHNDKKAVEKIENFFKSSLSLSQ